MLNNGLPLTRKMRAWLDGANVSGVWQVIWFLRWAADELAVLAHQVIRGEESDMDKVIDLGYANGWHVVPPIVVRCRELGHVREESITGRCVVQTSCKVCGYKYKVDSGD